jgi:hypothetical protein
MEDTCKIKWSANFFIFFKMCGGALLPDYYYYIVVYYYEVISVNQKWGRLHNNNIYECKQRQIDTNVSQFVYCAKVFP